MNLKNIERNPLDYIITDILPTELSEQFSYYNFYKYLIGKDKEIKKIIKEATKKHKNNETIFDTHCFKNCPLVYTIMKQLDTERSLSIIQPLASLQLFMFISIYQKELLTLIQKNSIFSLRYHTKNTELFYKNQNNSVINYFSDISQNINKEVIEQTGMYFNIGPCKSINSFTSSDDWFVLNSKYKYFIRADYKACFDSIYTHIFNLIIGKDVNDTRGLSKSTCIYSVIDRVLMNINATVSNGIVVGPEFSRMIAEILLQTIDKDVFNILLNENIKKDEHYNVYRYVDDIFIFSISEQLSNKILELYSNVSRKYFLRLNENKLYKTKVPFIPESWLKETNLFTNMACSKLFNVIENDKKEENSKPYILNSHGLSLTKNHLKIHFNELICKYDTNTKTIVSYFLGAILNKIGRNKNKINIFKENISESEVFSFLELVIFVYSFFPDYGNTQKLLAITSYVNDEFDIFSHKEKLQSILDKYSFIFSKANLNDIVNLIIFCGYVKIEIPYTQEQNIVLKLKEKDDPILWASYLLYTQYNQTYFTEIKATIAQILRERLEAIVDVKNLYMYREFWWIIVFNKSPFFIDQQNLIDDKLEPYIKSNKNKKEIEHKLEEIFLDYLNSDIPNQFFNWDIKKDNYFLKKITFKTRQRTIFKNYKHTCFAECSGV